MSLKMGFLNEQEQSLIEAAIKKAESGTSGEIVFAISGSSGRYQHATLQGAILGMAIATAVFLMIHIDHSSTHLLWTEFISFAVCYTILPYLPWRRWLIPQQTMDSRVKEAAFMQFYSSGLYKTRESNGVEIYLSLFERTVVVIGDQGIHAKMGDEQWNEVRNLIIQGIRNGKACEGICAAIDRCGEKLAEHFPHRSDDVNELPDQIIYRRS
jgi:putative membrane protein